MLRIIAKVLCLNCDKIFLDDKQEKYRCPYCDEILSIKKENMKYIVNKIKKEE
jgi:DNA-directed RNA polymerase subunit RPC12/RpoP